MNRMRATHVISNFLVLMLQKVQRNWSRFSDSIYQKCCNFNIVINMKMIEIVFHTKSAKSGVHFIFIAHFSLDQSHLEGLVAACGLGLPHWLVQFLSPKAAVRISWHHVWKGLRTEHCRL